MAIKRNTNQRADTSSLRESHMRKVIDTLLNKEALEKRKAKSPPDPWEPTMVETEEEALWVRKAFERSI